MIAVVSWIVVALATVASGLLATLSGFGYRFLLLTCLVAGLTPLGFVGGPGVPVFIPELLLVALALAFLVREFGNLPAVRLPTVVLVFVGYFLLQLVIVFLFKEAGVVAIIRDVRPVAFVGLLLLLSAGLSQVSTGFRVKESLLFVGIAACVLVDFMTYGAAMAGLISAGGISGEFYVRTGLIRYSDLLSLSIFGLTNYFIFYNQDRPAKSFLWLMILAAVVVLSLNRVYGLGFLIAFSWWLHAALKNLTRVPAISLLGAAMPLIALTLAGFYFAQSQQGSDEVVSRITELFDLSLLGAALEYRFVEPALIGGYELTAFTFLFGEGIGFEFFVPWFSYRGLDPWHFSVDSLFAFAFFKYGIVGLFVWVYAVAKFLWFRPWSIANAWIWLYWVVHSGVNVPSFMLFLVVLVVLRDGSWIEAGGRADQAANRLLGHGESDAVVAKGAER